MPAWEAEGRRDRVLNTAPLRRGTATPQAKTPQGTERVPRYSQQREDHALNLREPAPTSWTPQSDRLYTPHAAPVSVRCRLGTLGNSERRWNTQSELKRKKATW